MESIDTEIARSDALTEDRERGLVNSGPDLEDSGSLLQPRALLARLQRPGAAARRGPVGAAARAGQVRARSGSRTWTRSSWSGSPTCATCVESGDPGQDRRRDVAPPTSSRRFARGSLDQRERAGRTVERELRPALAEHGIRILTPEQASPEEREELEQLFERQVFPVLTPLVIGRGRPFPYISNLSLSLAVVLRDPEKDNEILARVKVPKELLRRFLAVGDERRHAGHARLADRRQPRVAVPGHGGARPRAVPGHPRHRLRRLRSDRRRTAGGRGGASPAALRRGGAARDRRPDERAPARPADRGARRLRRRGVRGRGPARPRRPLGRGRASRPRRPARPAVHAR